MLHKAMLLLIVLAAAAHVAAQAPTAHATPDPTAHATPEQLYYADTYADHYGVPRPLVHAIIRQESNWNARARSDKNARGLMQLMPDTARHYGVRDPYSVSENISGGVQYLADLMKQFDDLRLVVAGYYTAPRHLKDKGLRYSAGDVTAYVRQVRRYYEVELQKSDPDAQP